MDGCQEWAWLNGRGCGGNLISRTWWGSVISSWLKENLKAQPRYRCTVCVMGLLPTTRQPGSLNRELGDCVRQTNSNVMLWPPHPRHKHTYVLGHRHTTHWITVMLLAVLSAAINIYSWHLEIHLAGVRLQPGTHTSIYAQRSFLSISDQWLKWLSCVSA